MKPTKSSETSSLPNLSHTPWENPEPKEYHLDHDVSLQDKTLLLHVFYVDPKFCAYLKVFAC
jgi:hypothetical protein